MCKKNVAYLGFGVTYGFGRSWYYLRQLEDKSYDEHLKKIVHPVTKVKKISFTLINTTLSAFFWPGFLLNDLDIYEKKQMGVIEPYPPFPFNLFSWKKS